MKTICGNKLLPLMTTKEFLRSYLIKAATLENISLKFFQSDFKVEVYEKEFYSFIGNVECTYNCSVSYKRTENYVEYITKKENIRQPDGSYKTKEVSVPENKTRTVIDWQPYSGVNKGKNFVFVNSYGDWDKECVNLEKEIENIESEKYEESIELNADLVEKGKRALARSFAINTEISYVPGDKNKDFESREIVNDIESSRYLIPFYKIVNSDNGEQLSPEHNACYKNFEIILSEQEKEELEYIPVDTDKETKEKIKKLTQARNISFIAVLVGIILSGIMPIVGMIVFLLTAAASIFLTIKNHKKYKEIKSALDKEESQKRSKILDEKRQKVYENLCATLKKLDLDSITYEELYNN